ncbi:MAG: xylulose kinase [Chloroflexi bacterium]|nr:xylulose kinase [Chloroflexota bacterium]
MYVMGIDSGTEAIKAGLFDVEGNLIASASQNYPTYFPKPGWAEQDPDDWWDGLVGAVQECLKRAAVSPESVVGLSVDGTTCTLLPIKANGEALRRALLWMDVRATEQAQRIFHTGHDALRYSLTGVSAEWMPAKMLWLKEHEPETYQEADYILESTDWLIYKLTGRIALNINTIAQRWYYHTPSGGWPLDFYETIGLGGIERKFPPDILRIGEPVGPLAQAAAWRLGLPVGIPVAQGGGDAFIGLLGLGVVEPGDLGMVMGSSNVLSGLTAEEVHFPGIFGSFPDAVVPGLNLIEGGRVSTGSILNWFKRNFAHDLVEQAARTGISPYKVLDEEASQIGVGSDGLIVLDYFQGNRTPHTDSLARGVVLGLSLQASRAHVFRAIMEGIAYGTKDILDTFASQKCAISRVIACGGATHSKLFMQIYADVIGQPIVLTRVPEASLLGTAVAAAVGAGWFPTLPEASRKMTRVTGEYLPDPERHQQYQFYVDQYRQTYQQLKTVMHNVTRHSTAS